MENKKPARQDFLEAVLQEIEGAIREEFGLAAEPEQHIQTFGLIRAHLIQSFKNGIEVGRNRGNQKTPPQKRKG